MRNTFRRDKLLRLARAGKLFVMDSYSFDDMRGESKLKNPLVNTAINVYSNASEFKHGVFNVPVYDFSASSGAAWLNGDGTVTLYVHSNCNYTFRIAV